MRRPGLVWPPVLRERVPPPTWSPGLAGGGTWRQPHRGAAALTQTGLPKTNVDGPCERPDSGLCLSGARRPRPRAFLVASPEEAQRTPDPHSGVVGPGKKPHPGGSRGGHSALGRNWQASCGILREGREALAVTARGPSPGGMAVLAPGCLPPSFTRPPCRRLWLPSHRPGLFMAAGQGPGLRRCQTALTLLGTAPPPHAGCSSTLQTARGLARVDWPRLPEALLAAQCQSARRGRGRPRTPPSVAWGLVPRWVSQWLVAQG